MPYRTHSLDLLLALAAIFPSGLSYSLSYAFGGKAGGPEDRPRFLVILSLPFFALVLLSWWYIPKVLDIALPTAMWLGLGVVSIAGVFVVEFLGSSLYFMAKNRILPRGLGLHPFWSGGMTVWQHASMIVIAVGEEFVFRKLGFLLLGDSLGLGVPATLAVTAFFYALNHTFFGPGLICAKFLSGILYGVLFIASGSLIPSIIAHLGYNYALLAVAGRGHHHSEKADKADKADKAAESGVNMAPSSAVDTSIANSARRP